jgi:hemolysin activation/secretion protein
VLGSYATVKPFSDKASIAAKSGQIRARYTVPFKPLYSQLQHFAIAGLDYKYTNSNVLSLTPDPETELLGPPVIKSQNVTQVYADYTIRNQIGGHSLAFALDFYASPFPFLSNQSNGVYEKLRENSRNKYYYFYCTAADVYTLPKVITVSLLLRGQISSGTLPSTEVLGLGGYNTVRGYHQRELSTDNGFIGNIELRTPTVSVLKKWKDKLLFLAFLDYGIGNNWFVKKTPHKRHPPYTQYLLGVGPGLRYSINPYLQVRCDYGFKLHHLYMNSDGERQLRLGFGQFHLGALASY